MNTFAKSVQSIWNNDALKYIGYTTVDKVVLSKNVAIRTEENRSHNLKLAQHSSPILQKTVGLKIAECMSGHLVSQLKNKEVLDQDIFKGLVSFNEVSHSTNKATKELLKEVKKELEKEVKGNFFGKKATIEGLVKREVYALITYKPIRVSAFIVSCMISTFLLLVFVELIKILKSLIREREFFKREKLGTGITTDGQIYDVRVMMTVVLGLLVAFSSLSYSLFKKFF